MINWKEIKFIARPNTWYDEGTEAYFSVTSPAGFIIQQVFTGWSGHSNTTSPASKIIMDSSKTITANWRTDYTQLYILATLLILLAAGFMIINRRRLHEAHV